MLPLPASHASTVLRYRHEPTGFPETLPLGHALAALRRFGSRLGLLIV